MSIDRLPTQPTVEKLLQCLLGDHMEVSVSATGPEHRFPIVVAQYVDDHGTVQRVMQCELRLANALGAVMSMTPATVAM